MFIRRLLDGERFSHQGRFYAFDDALCEPRPVQRRLPILVGGSGPRKTLRTVALRADGWNTSGTLEEVEGRLAILAEHCSDVGRDLSTIEKTVSFPILVRDDRAEAERVYAEHLAINGTGSMGNGPALRESPAQLADAILPFAAAGFETVICRMSAPYDDETIDRMAEVRELLDG